MTEERKPRGIKLNRGQDDDMPEGTYDIEAYCDNCEWEGNVAIPKGTPAPYEEPLGNISRCEHCGCYTLVRMPYEEVEEEEEVVVQEDNAFDEAAANRLADMQRWARDREREQHRVNPPVVAPVAPVSPTPPAVDPSPSGPPAPPVPYVPWNPTERSRTNDLPPRGWGEIWMKSNDGPIMDQSGR